MLMVVALSNVGFCCGWVGDDDALCCDATAGSAESAVMGRSWGVTLVGRAGGGSRVCSGRGGVFRCQWTGLEVRGYDARFWGMVASYCGFLAGLGQSDSIKGHDA